MAALQRIMLAAAGVVIASSMLHAQPSILRTVPQKISYQAVARDASGRVVPNKQIVVRISILGGGPTGPVQYSETHEVRTNQFGLFALQIGGGSPTVGQFKDIPWTDGNQWARVELDPNGGTNYLPAGESQLLSVPYALVANKSVDMKLSDITDINLTTPGPGQILVFDGTNWVNTTFVDTAGNRGVLTTSRLTGNGLPGSPLDIAGQGARPGQVLKWNGTAWVPGNDSVGAGGGGGGNYIAGNGISIIGNTISHTIWQDNATSTSYMGGSVGIGAATPNASALLDLSSTRQGILIPRMTTAQLGAIAQPATSLLVFNTTNARFEYNAGTPAAPNWQALGGGGATTVNINNLSGAGPGNNAGSVVVPNGADSMQITAPGLRAGAVVTVTLYDPSNQGIIAHVSNKVANTGFTVRFSAPFPNVSGAARIDYIIVNP